LQLWFLLVGWVGMNGLASLKQPPAEAKAEERPIQGAGHAAARPEDYPVVITGYGEAKALTVVTIAPEVAGRLVYTHPMFKAGQIIPAGEVMFRIDPADYEAGLQEAECQGQPVAELQSPALKNSLPLTPASENPGAKCAHLAKT
jgi:multidrug efflux pump subunit AcrA (membrane-fusion protein)